MEVIQPRLGAERAFGFFKEESLFVLPFFACVEALNRSVIAHYTGVNHALGALLFGDNHFGLTSVHGNGHLLILSWSLVDISLNGLKLLLATLALLNLQQSLLITQWTILMLAPQIAMLGADAKDGSDGDIGQFIAGDHRPDQLPARLS